MAIFCGTIPSAVYAGRLNAIGAAVPGAAAAGGAMGGVAVSQLFYIPFTVLTWKYASHFA